MPKAVIQDVLDEGFRPAQFGFADNATTGWNDSDGYIDRVLSAAGRWTRDAIGLAAYDAVVDPSFAFDCLTRAEVCYSKTVLFKRRVAFLDSSGSVGMGARDTQYLDRREMLAHADAAWDCAQAALADAIRATGGDPTTLIDGVGASVGHIETGGFPRAVPGAINA